LPLVETEIDSESAAPPPKSNSWTYWGTFLAAFATLMYEVLLARILSLTMFPHISFVAVSVVMFGMTAGALFTYLFPSLFPEKRTGEQLTWTALLFAISVVLTMWIQLRIDWRCDFTLAAAPVTGGMLLLNAIPFVISGICICLAMTRFPTQVGKMYAADLSGAAMGCFALPLILDLVDGVTATIVVSLLASLAAVAFSFSSTRLSRIFSLAVTALLLLFIPINANTQFMKIEFVRGEKDFSFAYQKWNSYSRVTVQDTGSANCWALSSVVPPNQLFEAKYIDIDHAAGTSMPIFKGDLKPLDYLKYDLTNVGYYLRPDASVLIIGVGGGRDILSALVFGARQVTAVEINAAIFEILRQRYSYFTQVAFDPHVHLINEDARSYATRTRDSYDFIQMSLVDTFAATAAGALMFAENSIYTVDAWRTFLQRLTPRGMFSFSYWYEPEPPVFFPRMLVVACTAMRLEGISDYRRHLIVVETEYLKRRVATLLVSREPFTQADIDKIRDVANRLKFNVLLDPEHDTEPSLVNVINNSNSKEFFEKSVWRMDPPTDECPFPFMVGKINWHTLNQPMFSETSPLIALGILSIVSFAATVFPLFFTYRRFSFGRALPFFVYFFAIGLGFMLFEISQLQRLNLFLGQPTYSLSVVLATLLASSGLGSYFTELAIARRLKGGQLIMCTIVALFLYQFICPFILGTFQTLSLMGKIPVAIVLLFPIGFTLGFAFPTGIKAVFKYNPTLSPWMWAINGAASGIGSVAAALLAMNTTISLVSNLSWVTYIIVLIALLFFPKGVDERSLV